MYMDKVTLTILLVLAIIVLLILRELVCWYFRLRSIDNRLADILNEIRAQNKANGITLEGARVENGMPITAPEPASEQS